MLLDNDLLAVMVSTHLDLYLGHKAMGLQRLLDNDLPALVLDQNRRALHMLE